MKFSKLAKMTMLLLVLILVTSACNTTSTTNQVLSLDNESTTENEIIVETTAKTIAEESELTVVSEKEFIETILNFANNEDQEWTYTETADAWVLSVVSAVAYPELANQQGVSVSVPGAYVTGIDSDGDSEVDITADTYSEAV